MRLLMTDTKLSRVEVLNKLMEIVRSCTNDPADELIAPHADAAEGMRISAFCHH